MKNILSIILSAVCISAFADLRVTAFGAGAKTNITIVSKTHIENAWQRKVVMKNGDGEIINDDDQVAELASTEAIDYAATNAVRISEAANTSMTNALQTLSDASRNAATNSVGLALVFEPSTSRTNLTAYCVKTWVGQDGMDHQLIWYNKVLDLQLNRYVVYQTYDKCVTNKCEWADWESTTTVTENGKTWVGCRECRVSRPSWAVGERCLDAPNEVFGGPNGFDFGDMLLTMGDIPLFTGAITNSVTGQVAYFDNGFFKGFITE